MKEDEIQTLIQYRLEQAKTALDDAQFLSILLVSPLADGRTWVLMRDFGHGVGADGRRKQITGPRSGGVDS